MNDKTRIILKISILILSVYLVISCSGTKRIVQNSHDRSSYLIKEIKAKNSWYIIYAEKQDSLYKIVVRKGVKENHGCSKISVGNYYKLKLIARSEKVPEIRGVKLKPINSLDIQCYEYDENTEICIEPEKGIYDLYYTKDLKGLCYAPEENKELKEDSLVRLIKLAYDVRVKPCFDSVSMMLRDRIMMEQGCWIFVTDEIDTINRVVSKSYNQRFFSSSSRPKELSDVLEVCIKNRDTILANLNEIEFSDLKDIVKKFGYTGEEHVKHSNANLNANEWNKRTVFKLSLDFIERDVELVAKSKLYFKCLHEIMQVLESVRNEQAIKKWGKSFEYLKFDQKVEIIEMIPCGVVLILDSGCEELQLPSSEKNKFGNYKS